MSSEWPSVRLGDHVESCLGKMLDAKKNKGVPQPYLGNSNVRWGNFDVADLAEMRFESHEDDRYGLQHGDLVVCEGGEPGRCAIWIGAAGTKIQKALHRIRPKAVFNNYYLFYWFCHAAKSGLIDPYFTGTTIKHLTGKAIASLKVSRPPIEAQVAMVGVLKSLDDRITLLRETNATLEAIAQALFKSWFVDFDPVRAKMEGRIPEGMDEDTARLFPDALEESELGLVPRGWRVGTVDDIAILKGGKQLEKDAFEVNGANPVFGGAGEMGRSNLLNASGFVITVGRVGAYCGQFFWHIGDAWVNNNASHIKPRSTAQSIWLFQWLRTVNMDLIKKGAAQPFVSNGDIALLKMTIPTAPVIDSFIDISEPIFRKIHTLHEQIKTLATLRDTLLPRLISGQLRLPEVEAHLEDATA